MYCILSLASVILWPIERMITWCLMKPFLAGDRLLQRPQLYE